MNQLKIGALLSYINIVLTNGIGLVLTPFIVRALGDSEYGLYTLIGAFIGYVTIMDLGLNNTIIRYVSKYRAQHDKNEEGKFLGTAFIIYGLISIVIILLGIGFYCNIDSIFSSSLTEKEIDKAKLMTIILIFNLAITIPGGAFTAISNAYEKFIFPRVLANVKYVFRAILVVLVLSLSADSLKLVLLDTILNIIAIAVTFFYVKKHLKVKIKFLLPHKKVFLEIFSYSFWIFLFSIAYNLQWMSGQTILGITTNTKTVAIYGIGIMLGGYYGAFAGAINTLLLPRATSISVNNDSAITYTNEIIKVGKINIFILLLILTGFILLGKDFIKLWVGETYLESWYIALFIMISMTLPLVQAFGNSILEAKKKNRFKSTLSITTLIIASVIGFFLSKTYGLIGMISPIAIAVFINSIIMSYYFQKIFQFNFALFLRKVFLKPLIINTILLAIAMYIYDKIGVKNWLQFAIAASVYGICYLLVNYLFTLGPLEKNQLKILKKHS